MGLFNRAEDEAEKLAQDHQDQASQLRDKAEQTADQATGNRFDDQIQSGMQDAEKRIGMQGGQDQDQDQDQDPNTWGNQGQ